MMVVRQAFRPEFLNRLDEILLFRRLLKQDMGHIVKIQLEGLEKTLKDHHMTLTLTPEALHWLAEKGYDPVYGARPLKRVIQREVQNPLSLLLLEGTLKEGDSVLGEQDEDRLVFHKEST